MENNATTQMTAVIYGTPTRFPNSDPQKPGKVSALLDVTGATIKVTVVKTENGYTGLYPQLKKTDKDGNVSYKTVITGKRAELNEKVTALVESGDIIKLEPKEIEGFGTIIGFAIVKDMAVKLSVDVYTNRDGKPYIKLPAAPYPKKDDAGNAVLDEEGKPVMNPGFFVRISKERCDELAAEAVAKAVDKE
jgi:hypothetical protein